MYKNNSIDQGLDIRLKLQNKWKKTQRELIDIGLKNGHLGTFPKAQATKTNR